MLLETKRLDVMREKTKRLAAAAKNASSKDSFLRQISIHSTQVNNLHIQAHIGLHSINVDEPIESGGDDIAPSPVDTLLAALGACTEINWIAYSSAYSIDVRNVEVRVDGFIDQRYVLGGSTGVPARLTSIKITSNVVTSAPLEKVERVHVKVQQFCPVGGSLHPDIKKEYILNLQPPV